MVLPCYHITPLNWWVISGMEAAGKLSGQWCPGQPAHPLPGHRLALGSPEIVVGMCRRSTLQGDDTAEMHQFPAKHTAVYPGYLKYEQQMWEIIFAHKQHQLSFSLQKRSRQASALLATFSIQLWCEAFSGGKISFGKSVVSSISSIPVEFNHHLGKMFFDNSFHNCQYVLSMGFKWNSSYLWVTNWGQCSAERLESSGFLYPCVSQQPVFLVAEKQLHLKLVHEVSFLGYPLNPA